MPTPDEVAAAMNRWIDANENDPKGEHYDTVQRIADRELLADDYPRLQADRDRINQALQNLLVVIHRDGGHHTEAVGLERSATDAEAAVASGMAGRDRLAEQLADCQDVLRVISASGIGYDKIRDMCGRCLRRHNHQET